MKNEIFKVCTLGLVAVTLITGCNKNEKGVDTNKVAKEEFVQAAENVNVHNVVKVDLDNEQLDEETVRLFVNATDIDGKSVWTIELGNVPYGIGLENWLSYQGKDIYYLSTNSGMSAYDIETGKELWSSDRNFGGWIYEVKEKDNKLAVFMSNPEGKGYLVRVIDTKTGNVIEDIDTDNIENYEF